MGLHGYLSTLLDYKKLIHFVQWPKKNSPETGPEFPSNFLGPFYSGPFGVFDIIPSVRLAPKSFGFLSFLGNSGPVSGQKLSFFCMVYIMAMP